MQVPVELLSFPVLHDKLTLELSPLGLEVPFHLPVVFSPSIVFFSTGKFLAFVFEFLQLLPLFFVLGLKLIKLLLESRVLFDQSFHFEIAVFLQVFLFGSKTLARLAHVLDIGSPLVDVVADLVELILLLLELILLLRLVLAGLAHLFVTSLDLLLELCGGIILLLLYSLLLIPLFLETLFKLPELGLLGRVQCSCIVNLLPLLFESVGQILQ